MRKISAAERLRVHTIDTTRDLFDEDREDHFIRRDGRVFARHAFLHHRVGGMRRGDER